MSLSQRILRASGAAIACASMVALSLTAAQPAAAAVTVIRHTLPVADQSVEPNSIVEGSDGNLWYTYSFQADVGRITPSGMVTDFPIPTVNADSGGIAAGSDGALWFCEFQGEKIGRITTSGSVTEYTASTRNQSAVHHRRSRRRTVVHRRGRP